MPDFCILALSAGPRGLFFNARREHANPHFLNVISQDMRLYQRYLEYRATTFMGGGSTCLSGRTMAYRTLLFHFDGFKNYFLNEHFAGQLQLSGDDKCLTRLCIMSDYKMWHQICEVSCSKKHLLCFSLMRM